MAERRRKFWGWGYEDQGPNPEQQKRMAERMAKRFGLGPLKSAAAEGKRPEPARAACQAARVARGDLLDRDATSVPVTATARAPAIFVRAFRRYYPNPLDLVAFPRDEKELMRVLEWCDGANFAAVPYGGGSSVVGGVEPPEGDRIAARCRSI